MRRPPTKTAVYSPAVTPTGVAAGDLPARYTPQVAGFARGPWLTPAEGFASVLPTSWKWRNARTYIVRADDGLDYRALRVYETKRLRPPSNREVSVFIGYWAVELLGTPLGLPEFQENVMTEPEYRAQKEIDNG